MYTDINAERAIVTTPQMEIGQKIATNCVRLAHTVLSYAAPYAQQTQPTMTTRVQDAFFALKPSVFQKMVNTENFFEYYFAQIEQGTTSLDVVVMEYKLRYLSQGKSFEPRILTVPGGGDI